MRSGWVRTKDRRGVVVTSSSSHVKVGEDEAWAKRHRRCVVVVAGACGGREGVAGMQTRTAGTRAVLPAM